MRIILIIGAGFGQVPGIRKAKEMGYVVVAVDRDPNAPGMKLADHAYEVDVLDQKQILEIAIRHKIDGVFTLQTDLPMPTVGYINDHFGFSGVSLQTANFCSHKIETRRRLQTKNCAQPEFAIVDDLIEAQVACEKIKFPCVIKAPDSSGSRGVVKVVEASQIANAMQEALSFSRGKSILVEEFIDGLEFGAQTFSVDGICELVLFHNDTMSKPPHMIPVGHSFPFQQLTDAQRQTADRAVKQAVEALGIQNGPANVDLILDKKNNQIKIIEIGARIGATCLPELVELFSGIDWVGESIKSCLGQPVDLQMRKHQPVAALILEAPKDGIFIDCQIDANPEDFQVKEFEVTVHNGDRVSQLRKGTDRIGKIVCTGATAQQAENFANAFRNKITFEISES